MSLPLHSYVKIKPDSELLDMFGVPEMAGKVVEYDGFLNTYTVQFDAQTLNSLSDDFIRRNLSEYLIIDEYEADADEVEPAERRDTDEQYATAKARLDCIEQELTAKSILSDKEYDPELGETPFDDPERTKKILLNEFEHSDVLADLTPEVRSSYTSDASLLLEVATNHFGYQHPEEWPAGFMTEYALGHLPRKLMAPAEEFETIGKQLLVFVHWLYEEEVTDVGRMHVKDIRAAIPKMVAAAGDTSKHGLAKGLFSSGLFDEVDFDDEASIAKSIDRFNNMPREERVALTGGPERPPARVAGMDPFRNIGRNDRIDVRDTETGEVQKGVKFKFVEAGLRSGDLELV